MHTPRYLGDGAKQATALEGRAFGIVAGQFAPTCLHTMALVHAVLVVALRDR